MQCVPKTFSEAKRNADHLAHHKMPQSVVLGFGQLGIELDVAFVCRCGLKDSERHRQDEFCGGESGREAARCYPNLTVTPADPLDYRVQEHGDSMLLQFTAKVFDQRLVTAFHVECTIAVDLFLRAQAVHQRVHTDQRGISSMKTSHVPAGPVLCLFVPGLAATAFYKVQKGLIRLAIVHLGHEFVHFSEEIAGTQFTLFGNPVFTTSLPGGDFLPAQDVPDFSRTTVDEFRAELYGSVRGGIMPGENSSADSVACLEDRNLVASTGQFEGRGESCSPGPNYDNLIVAH